MKEPKKKTLVGKLIASAVNGIVDGFPVVSGVVNTIRQHKADKAEPVQESPDLPWVRILSGIATVGAVAYGLIKGGALDCDALTKALQAFGLL